VSLFLEQYLSPGSSLYILAGARADLLELAQVTYIKSRTAQVFWENGYKSVRLVAEATPADIIPVLIQVY
jgi:hypothetical protein